ncbi:MAG: PorT family protein [Chitinophagaceae bacterium]|nr:PorT family protein [Chitinophagaceae bacterium]
MKQKLMIVKNFVLLFVLSCAFFISSVAQERKTPNDKMLTPKVGVKGGINFTNLYVDDVKDENMKIGFNLGLFAKLPVTQGLSIQPEILYSVKGSKLAYDLGVLGSNEYRFNLNYVEVPILAVINLSKNFNLQAGGYAAYLAQANIKRANGDGTNDQIADLNEENFNRLDYGLVGGLGIDVENITIGARYNYGLREVGKADNFGSQALKNSKNSAISLYIGFGF